MKSAPKKTEKAMPAFMVKKTAVVAKPMPKGKGKGKKC